MPPGQEQVAIIVDVSPVSFSSYSSVPMPLLLPKALLTPPPSHEQYKSATSQSNPSIGTARKVLHILQNHYVERLGRGLVVNMP